MGASHSSGFKDVSKVHTARSHQGSFMVQDNNQVRHKVPELFGNYTINYLGPSLYFHC